MIAKKEEIKNKGVSEERKEGVKNKEGGFFRKAKKGLLIAGLTLAITTGGVKCGDEYTITYNECAQDAQQQKDVSPSVKDAGDTCVRDLSPTTCDSSKPLAEGLLKANSPLSMGNFVLKLEQIEQHDNENYAIVDINNNCGEVVRKVPMKENMSIDVTIAGAKYTITVKNAYLSNADQTSWLSSWLDISVSVDCSNMCEMIHGVLNIKDTLPFDTYRLRFDDIDNASGKPSAVVSILDESGNVFEMLTIPKGEYAILEKLPEKYKVYVKDLAAGYQLNSVWANIEISKPCKE